jgi:hypothetical protein
VLKPPHRKNIAILQTFKTAPDLDRVLVGEPEGKRPLGRPSHRWEDNIKMDLQEVGGGHGLIWIGIVRGGGLL